MTLPIADEPVTVTITDKVYVSLRTKSARGQGPFSGGAQPACRLLGFAASSPLALKPDEVKALAAESYREAVDQLGADRA